MEKCWKITRNFLLDQEANMGLEQENPVLFLEQAKEAVKQLEDCRVRSESALEKEKQGKLDLEQETEALKQKIEKTTLIILFLI